MSDLPRLLTVEATARELSYSARHVLTLIKRGQLEAIGYRRGRRVVGASIERYIAAQAAQQHREAIHG